MDKPLRLLLSEMQAASGVSEAILRRLRESVAIDLPSDYLEFLRYSNGAEGAIGPNYLAFWPAEEIAITPYPWGKIAPGILFFGGDGGAALFGFDTRVQPMPIVITHSDDLALETLVPVAVSFTEFLEFLDKHDWNDFWSEHYQR